MNARDWLLRGGDGYADVQLLGAPVSKASISPSQAWSTPPAFRDALARFSTWDAAHQADLESLRVRDLGDVLGDRDDSDCVAARSRIERAVAGAVAGGGVLAIIGGDNSLTYPALHALMSARADSRWGLLTLDAHHDCRPLDAGPRNGTPVRELIESGLPGELVAQVGIQPFANERAHAEWAAAQGVRVHPIAEVRASGIATVMTQAVTSLLRAGAEVLYVDIDIDCVDRAFAPACPASLPGGLLPHELQEAAHLLGALGRVAAVDITEVDAIADVNHMTVLLAASTFLHFCGGVVQRPPENR